jgi:hypothetical protein
VLGPAFEHLFQEEPECRHSHPLYVAFWALRAGCVVAQAAPLQAGYALSSVEPAVQTD